MLSFCVSRTVVFVCCSLSSYFFFFQAEDGIRDTSVTGVQTCALPISAVIRDAKISGFQAGGAVGDAHWHGHSAAGRTLDGRSEERRVGKECRSRWWPDHEKKKKKMDTEEQISNMKRVRRE